MKNETFSVTQYGEYNMDYKTKECAVCGSDKLQLVSHKSDGINVFYTYRCESCGAIFSTQSAYKRKKLINKRHDETLQKQKSERVQQVLNANNQKTETETKELSATEIYKRNRSAVVEIISSFDGMYSYGTGTVLGNGYVLSNAHTIAEKQNGRIVRMAANVECIDESGISYYAKVVDVDENHDLSLLFVKEIGAKGVEFSNKPVETGNRIYAIGNTKGEGICLCEGIVSDKQRFVLDREVIMIAAPITNGNSGGPIFDTEGKVIGIVTFGRTDSLAMNFVIPVTIINAFLKRNINIDRNNNK